MHRIGTEQGRLEEAHEKAFLEGDEGTEGRPGAVVGSACQEITGSQGKLVNYLDLRPSALMVEEEAHLLCAGHRAMLYTRIATLHPQANP